MNKKTAFLSVAIATAVTCLSVGASAQSAQVAVDPATASTPETKPEPGLLQFGIYGFGSQLTLDNSLHAVGGSAPDPLKNAHLRFVGQGWMPGSEMRLTLAPRDGIGRARFGFSVGAGGATGFGVTSDTLAPGVSYRASALWGARFAGYIGQQFEIGGQYDADGIAHNAILYPYVDMTAVGTITQATLDLHVKGLGAVGTSEWDAYAFTLAPRAGVVIPLGKNVGLDLGGYKSVYGAEHYGGFAGITIIGP